MRFLLAVVFLLLPTITLAEDPASPATVVKGDVLYWEGEEIVVKEMSGREVRLHVNGETKISGTAGKLKTGDKIEAQVTPTGHATTITLQIPGIGSGPLSPP
jgi:hypothetical protein